jgi:hypothetical protein
MKRLGVAVLGLALIVSMATACRSSGYSQAEVEATVAAAQTADASSLAVALTATRSSPTPMPATPHSPAEPTSTPSELDFSEFAKTWSRHGFGMTIAASGEATASWRVYKWCSDDPTPPCDAMVGNEIVSGGHATVIFGRVDGASAYGWVKDSTVEGTLAPGTPVSLTLLPYGLALLQDVSLVPTVLCGPDTEMPDWLQETWPCGA